MRLIGFSGKARHGKDLCAALFRELVMEHPDNRGLIIPWSFALPLKAQVYGRLEYRASLEEILITKPPAVRQMQQVVGTDEGRERYGYDYWTLQAELFLDHLQRAVPNLQGVTFADVRFPNERAFVLRNGVSCGWPQHRVTGPGGWAFWIASDRPTLSMPLCMHSSETAFDGEDPEEFFTAVITNNRTTTIEDLKAQLRPWVDRYVREANRSAG